MITVAKHLRDHARKLENSNEVDLFGRSAFNRFYYACYWKVRTTFPDLATDWTSMGHKDLPTFLTGSVRDQMLRRINQLYGKKLLTQSGERQLRARSEHCLREIARLLRLGYSIRCTADYTPEQKSVQIGDSLMLDGTKLSTFETHFRDITKHVGMLSDCRKELGL